MEGGTARGERDGAGARHARSQSDPARSPFFRGLLAVQVVAAAFFGLVPFIVPGEFARLFQLRGDEPYVYRLAGAAATGYAVVAALGLVRGRWVELRIPLVATLSFFFATLVAALLSIEEAGIQPLSGLVLIVPILFLPITGGWLIRYWRARQVDRSAPRLEPGFRVTLGLATVAAFTFGVLPTLLPRTLMSVAGLAETDLVIVRLAGAGCFGYATAGVLQLLADRWPEIGLQNAAAITFNALGAIGSALYLANGGRSPLAVLLLVAAGFFAIALSWWGWRAAR